MKEATRDARGTRWLEDLWHDMRDAGRMMRRSPTFTLAAVLSLAIGIGANAAVFSVTDALVVRSLPVVKPGELYFLNRPATTKRTSASRTPTSSTSAAACHLCRSRRWARPFGRSPHATGTRNC